VGVALGAPDAGAVDDGAVLDGADGLALGAAGLHALTAISIALAVHASWSSARRRLGTGF
jgi:hypothetical protein